VPEGETAGVKSGPERANRWPQACHGPCPVVLPTPQEHGDDNQLLAKLQLRGTDTAEGTCVRACVLYCKVAST
jgi:hypothetical protein